MIKKLILLFTVPVLLSMSGCGHSKKEGNDIPGMSVYDLSTLGTPATIDVPDTTSTKLEAALQSSGTIVIKSGKDFQISITPGEGDVALKKSDISSDDVKKFKRFVVDEPNSLIWEAQVNGLSPEFHFYTIVKTGKESYVIEDIKDADSFGEESIKKMTEAAKTIKVKEAKNS
jgi:hypothetical protein